MNNIIENLLYLRNNLGPTPTIDLKNLPVVEYINPAPESNDPLLVVYQQLKYLLVENGVELDDSSMLFEDIEVNNWELDNTYNDYPYCANITLSDDVTSDMLYNVIYSKVDYQSGNYAEFATLQNGSITIYSKVNTTITIEAIIITY